jgi:hypothetical protein
VLDILSFDLDCTRGGFPFICAKAPGHPVLTMGAYSLQVRQSASHCQMHREQPALHYLAVKPSTCILLTNGYLLEQRVGIPVLILVYE